MGEAAWRLGNAHTCSAACVSSDGVYAVLRSTPSATRAAHAGTMTRWAQQAASGQARRMPRTRLGSAPPRRWLTVELACVDKGCRCLHGAGWLG